MNKNKQTNIIVMKQQKQITKKIKINRGIRISKNATKLAK